MAISANFEQYDINSVGEQLTTQSIVECRLNDWSENKILAVNATVSKTSCEVLSGEIRYGGKIYFSVLAATSEGTVTGAERAAEFSHKIISEDAAPALSCETFLKIEKIETRIDGKAVVLSAIVSASAKLILESRITCLQGGDGLVIKGLDVPVRRIRTFKESAEIEEEFETEYLGDVLSHCESAYVNKIIVSEGSVGVSGEIELGILAKRAGEKELVSFERLFPFSAEIPVAEAKNGDSADVVAGIRQVNISANCDEDKNKCAIVATVELELCGKVFAAQNVLLTEDAFSPSTECEIERKNLTFNEPIISFATNEKVSGTSALSGQVDFSCNMQAVTAPCLEITALTSENGEITAEGVLSATVLFTDKDNLPSSAQVNLPFAFPVKCDKAIKGDSVKISGIACGIYARQKQEGELEVDATLKLFISVYSLKTYSYVSSATEGSEIPENDSAISVYIADKGDGLWDVAKKLKKSPEEVSKYNSELEYPLKQPERIIIYRRKES